MFDIDILEKLLKVTTKNKNFEKPFFKKKDSHKNK